MNKYLPCFASFLWLFLVYQLPVWAQDKQPRDTVKTEEQTRDVNPFNPDQFHYVSWQDNMMGASPEAAKMTKYVDTPVSNAYGQAEIGIPIYTVQGRSLKQPIALSYDGSGIKPEEISGIVGLGWSLQAGGVITRTIIGRVDTGDEIPSESTNPSDAEWLVNHANSADDTEYDRYSYNFCGHSGSFYKIPNQGIVPTEPTELIISETLPFTITDKDGTKYIFGRAETSSRYMGSYDPDAPPVSQTGNYYDLTTAWYLTEIRSMDETDVITISYLQLDDFSHVSHSYYRSISFPYKYMGNDTWMTNLSGGFDPTPTFQTREWSFTSTQEWHPYVVSSITYNGGSVSFGYEDYSQPDSQLYGGSRRSYPSFLSTITVNEAGQNGLLNWTFDRDTTGDYRLLLDKAGRLTNSKRYIGSNTTGVNTLTERDITYDASGNLLTLNRYGSSSSTTPTESLSFTYVGPKRVGWVYDPNGNVTSDAANNGSLAWNVIDQPRTLMSATSSTQRFYLADGTLSHIEDGSQMRIYLGDIVYKVASGSASIESAGWEGGRLLPGTGNDKVLYYVNDHLGSVRAIKDGAGNIKQRYDYYPYGSVSRSWSSSTTDTPDKRYRFGGKEIAGSLLSATSAGADKYLDFGARLYNPRTALWLSQDPMAEKYYPFTPYLYCAANPVNVVDPEGKEIIVQVFQDNVIMDYKWMRVNGVWGFYDSDMNQYIGEDPFILSLSQDLMTIMNGEVGYSLIEELVGNPEQIFIKTKEGLGFKYFTSTKTISWNSHLSKKEASFLSLAHELAHAMDDLRGTINSDIWISKGHFDHQIPKDIKYSEIFAMHYENLIRKEQGYPLSKYYFQDECGRPAGPALIDSKNRSYYFNLEGKTNYKVLKPSQRYQY